VCVTVATIKLDSTNLNPQIPQIPQTSPRGVLLVRFDAGCVAAFIAGVVAGFIATRGPPCNAMTFAASSERTLICDNCQIFIWRSL
jgi:hypothetical protein